jgi:hypothetical protein
VGARSHLIEVVFGERSCDGDSSACATRAASGGWGPSSAGLPSQPIGNKQVKIYNNVIYNPAGHPGNDQHFAIYGPRTPTVAGIPSPQVTDQDLEIKGNVIWNGSGGHPLGVEGNEQGCQVSNVSCNTTQLLADNTINTLEPQLRDPANGDFRPVHSGNLFSVSTAPITQFPVRSFDEPTAEGELSNLFTRDFSGESFATSVVGAFLSSDSAMSPPGNEDGSGGDSQTPGDPGSPTITDIQLTARQTRQAYVVRVRVRATDDEKIVKVIAQLRGAGRRTLKLRGATYNGTFTLRRKRRIRVVVTATDNDRNVTSSSAVL